MEGFPAIKKKTFDFSIESLLKSNREQVYSDSEVPPNSKINYVLAKSPRGEVRDLECHLQDKECNGNEESETFSWLNCTRFKPPKLPRSKKRCNSTKRFGRGPRIPFSPQQIAILEHTFSSSQYLSSDNILGLAKALDLTETRVKIWFQNRRARYRREKEGQPNSPPGSNKTLVSTSSTDLLSPNTKEWNRLTYKSPRFPSAEDKRRPLSSPGETYKKQNGDSLSFLRKRHDFLSAAGESETTSTITTAPSSSLLYSKDFLLSSDSSKIYFVDYLRRHTALSHNQNQSNSGIGSGTCGETSFTTQLSPINHPYHHNYLIPTSSLSSLIHNSTPPLTFPYST